MLFGIVSLVVVLLMMMPEDVFSHGVSLGFGGGLMIEPDDCYDNGYFIGGRLYYRLSDKIDIGGGFNWHRNDNADAFCLAGHSDVLWVVEQGGGELTITEVVPSLKINLMLSRLNRIIIFFEAGARIFLLHVDRLSAGLPVLHPKYSMFEDDTRSKFGLSNGLGIQLR